MNGLQIYAFIVLPLSIAAAGWAYACFGCATTSVNTASKSSPL